MWQINNNKYSSIINTIKNDTLIIFSFNFQKYNFDCSVLGPLVW